MEIGGNFTVLLFLVWSTIFFCSISSLHLLMLPGISCLNTGTATRGPHQNTWWCFNARNCERSSRCTAAARHTWYQVFSERNTYVPITFDRSSKEPSSTGIIEVLSLLLDVAVVGKRLSAAVPSTWSFLLIFIGYFSFPKFENNYFINYFEV